MPIINRDTGEPIEPMGWRPGLDWEVYDDSEPPFRADLYSADTLLVSVTAATRVGLRLRMALAQWRCRRAQR